MTFVCTRRDRGSSQWVQKCSETGLVGHFRDLEQWSSPPVAWETLDPMRMGTTTALDYSDCYATDVRLERNGIDFGYKHEAG
jgi:hypothetical protein